MSTRRIHSEIESTKAAIVFGYNSEGYYGFQRQLEKASIEEALQVAIQNAGGTSKFAEGANWKVQWRKASRTDKGVGAAANVVSLRLLISTDLIGRINSHLSPQIRVYGFVPTFDAFDARQHCKARRYEYLIPVWALDPSICRPRSAAVAPGITGRGQILSPCTTVNGETEGHMSIVQSTSFCKASCQTSGEQSQTAGCFEDSTLYGEEGSTLRTGVEDLVRRLNRVLSHFEGTHNFHNFTSGRGRESASTLRHMYRVRCGCAIKLHGITFACVTLLGSSFMMYQIRKMIGIAIAVTRGDLPEITLKQALDPDQHLSLPTAPASGLLLDEVLYWEISERDLQDTDLDLPISALKLEEDEVNCIHACSSTGSHHTLIREVYDRKVDEGSAGGFTSNSQLLKEEMTEGDNGDGGLSGSDMSARFRSFREAARDFKERVLYPHIAAAVPGEMWQFVKGLASEATRCCAAVPSNRQQQQQQQQQHSGLSRSQWKQQHVDHSLGHVTGTAKLSAAMIVCAQETYGLRYRGMR